MRESQIIKIRRLYLWTVLGSANSQLIGIGGPGQVGHAIRVPLQHLAVLQGQGGGVKLPDDHRVVLAASGQQPAVRGPLAEPNLITVFAKHLIDIDKFIPMT